MKTVSFLLFILLSASTAFAGQITVNTGYGYYIKDGNIVMKAQLPQGVHPLTDGYTYVEVANQKELDDIKIYVPTPTAEETFAQKVAIQKDADATATAIQELQESGTLTAAESAIATTELQKATEAKSLPIGTSEITK